MKRIDEIDQGKSWVEIGYYLDDNQGEPLPSTRNANTVQVDFLGPAQQVLMQEDLQTQVRVPHVGIDLYTLNGREGISETQQDGTFRAIFMAEDGHGSEYRDHRNKRMMPVNKAEKFIKYFHVEDDWMVSPADGALFPQARSDAMEEAFQGTGWRLVNASTSPKQVLPAACTAVPYEYILGGSERRNYSQDHFYYYTARKTPAYVTQNKWGRYVHVIGANWEKTPTADISQGREMGYTDHDERYSFIYVKEILNKGHETHGVRMTAIHEVGHQFNPGHQHGKEATPAEEEAYEKGNITVLRNYRSRPLPGVTNPGREGFYQCVMYPGFSKDVTLDHLFCPYHKEIIRGYQGW
jgi:hypothetical protein